jgi:sigma-E factor negative regulatory protein RseB
MAAHVRAAAIVCRARRAGAVAFALIACAFAELAAAQDANALLNRAATAARLLNYTGTLVIALAASRRRGLHLNEGGKEFEKLVNLEGPAREVIRSDGEVRCYYPDAKVVRIEPRTFRNAFPSLSAQQQKALTEYYELRKAEVDRVAGLDVQAWVFEPKDGLRYGQKLWFERDRALLKARIQNERNEPVEVFTFN